jgi:indole-3-glycerol phosphate synthase
LAPGVTLIAECKKASPSKGLLARNYDPIRLADDYLRAGAGAISVLTDARFFQGSIEDLRDVKEFVTSSGDLFREVPVIRKDFVFHPYQVYEARAAGADAILLIAAALGDSDLKRLFELARQLGMDALLEAHSPQEIERVLHLEPRVVGINNRNLRTFEVDFENSARLRGMIPEGIAVVAESGLKRVEDMRRMASIGADAVLVGEALVSSRDVYATTSALVDAGQRS